MKHWALALHLPPQTIQSMRHEQASIDLELFLACRRPKGVGAPLHSLHQRKVAEELHFNPLAFLSFHSFLSFGFVLFALHELLCWFGVVLSSLCGALAGSPAHNPPKDKQPKPTNPPRNHKNNQFVHSFSN